MIIAELPQNCRIATVADLFYNSDFNPMLIMGIEYYVKQGAIWRKRTTNEYTVHALMMSDIRAERIWISNEYKNSF